MAEKKEEAPEIENGIRCMVVSGTHAGKAGMVNDRKISKSGHATITVVQVDGARFKTLAKNVVQRHD